MKVIRSLRVSSSVARLLSSPVARVALGVALFAGIVATAWLATGQEVHIAAPMPSF